MISDEYTKLCGDVVAAAIETLKRTPPDEERCLRLWVAGELRSEAENLSTAEARKAYRRLPRGQRKDVGAAMRRIVEVERDRTWLMDASRSAAFVEVAGLDYDALLSRLAGMNLLPAPVGSG